MIYDRKTKLKHVIDKRTDGRNLGSYPVFMPDGRLIYSNHSELVVVDPHQITKGRLYDSCIEDEDLLYSTGNDTTENETSTTK